MRKLATIRKINDIRSIPNVDKICIYIVDGWHVVDYIGKYKIDDLVIMVEIDSWIPTEIAPFLTKEGNQPKEYLGIKGERLKSKKLKGQISQGLILPFHILSIDYDGNEGIGDWQVGDDVTDALNIKKWEPSIPAQLQGIIRGNFPSEIPKTDQERVQNIVRELEQYKEDNIKFELTEKLDGSSCTMYLDINGEFHVCSRNIDLKEDQNNTFWKMAKKYDIENKLKKENLFGHAIQGEVIGNGIQGNKYKLSDNDFYVFDVFKVKENSYIDPVTRKWFCYVFKLNHVPIIGYDKINNDIQELLIMAEGKSKLNINTEREGIVFKSMSGIHSFKAISNKFLMKSE